MTTSYYDSNLKLNSSDAFYNIEVYNKYKRQTISNPNFKPSPQFNYETDKFNADFNRQDYIRITPTTLSNYVYSSGGYLDYTLPVVPGVIDRQYIDLQITNQNALNNLHTPSIPLTFSIKTMTGSNEINTFDGDDQLLYCYRYINDKNKAALLNQFGITMQVGGAGLLSINPQATVSYLIPIRTLLSDVNFFYPSDSIGLKIRIQFRNGISSNTQNVGVANGGVGDNQIFINKCDLIVHYTELTNVNLKPLISQNFWDYKVPSFFEHNIYPFTVNSLVQGNTYNIKMTSLQGLSANFMLIWIRIDNPTISQGLDSLLDSKLTNIDIQNVNNKSLYSSYYLDYNQTNAEFYSRLFGKHDVLWEYVNDYAGLSRIVFIPLGVHTSGVKCYINEATTYGCPYTFDTDHYLKFQYNGNTVNGNYNLHCLFAHISWLRVDATQGLNNLTMKLYRS
jgi:hypothetical protein